MTEQPTVLVVEDEESFVEALVVGLKREGFRVKVARDGLEALEVFDASRPDLVLLDVMLPRMSGVDVCREIRNRSRVPIVMVTAKASEIDTVVGLEVGDVRLDPERHEVVVRGDEIALPLKEFEVLELLLDNAGRVLTRETLIDRVWGPHYVGDTKTLDVHIKRLRAKVEKDPSRPTRITTIRGLGYRYEKPR